jgi:hypothetical protein
MTLQSICMVCLEHGAYGAAHCPRCNVPMSDATNPRVQLELRHVAKKQHEERVARLGRIATVVTLLAVIPVVMVFDVPPRAAKGNTEIMERFAAGVSVLAIAVGYAVRLFLRRPPATMTEIAACLRITIVDQLDCKSRV